MDGLKNKVKYPGFILVLVCMAFFLCVMAVNFTRFSVFAGADTGSEGGFKEVFPEALRFEPVKSGADIFYYNAFGADGHFKGVVFNAIQNGYSGAIESLVGMKKDGTIIAIKILNQNESPDVGARVAGPDFTGRFKDKNAMQLNAVEAISGATISSKAVVDSVRKKAEEILPLINRQE